MAGTQLADAYVQIVPSMRGVQGAIASGFGSNLDKSASAAGRRGGGLLQAGLVGGLAGGIAGVATTLLSKVGGSIASFVGQAVKASDATDKFKQTLQFAGLNTKAIDAATKRSQTYADQTVYDLTTIQNTTAQLAANGVKNYSGLTEAAGNLNAVAGGNADTFKSVALVLTQTSGAGKLTTENYNQLAEAIPGASGILQKALKDNGAYTGNFRDAMAAGQITADEFNKAIQQVGSQPIAVEAAKSTTTFEGAIGNLQATIVGGLTSALNSIKPAATGAITAVSTGLGKLFTFIGTVVTAIGPPLAEVFGRLKGPALGFIKSLEPIGTALLSGLQPLIPTFVSLAGQAITLASSLSPMGLLFKALVPLLPQLIPPVVALAGALGSTLSAVLGAVLPVIVQLAGTLTGVLGQVIAALVPVIVSLASSFGGILTSTISTLLPVIVNLVNTLGPVLTGVITAILPVVLQLVGVIASLVPVFVPIIAQVVKLAASLIAQLVPALLPLVKAVLPLLSSVIKALVPVVIPLVKILGTTLANVISDLLPLISTVIGAIVPIIKSLVKIVVGVVDVISGVLTGNFDQVWRGLGGIVSGAFDLVINVLKGAVKIVGAAIGAIVKVVGDVFGGLVSTVTSIAGNIVDGLVNGFKSAWKGALEAVKGLVNLLPDVVKKLLGIASPSRVFASIGRFVGQGLVKGLDGTQDQVKSAATSLVNQVTDAFTKLADQREAAQKRLTTLNKRLASTDTSSKSGAKTAAGLRDQIKEQRGLLADIAAAPKGADRKSLLASIKTDNASLVSLAGTRDRLATSLKSAQDALADAVKTRDDFRDSVQQTSIALGDVVASFNTVADARKSANDSITDLTTKVGDAVKQQATAQAALDSTNDDITRTDAALAAMAGSGNAAADAIAKLQQHRLDLAGNLTSQLADVAKYATATSDAQADLAKAQSDATQSSTPKILDTLRAAVTNTQAFQGVLASLKAQGLDSTTYSQLVAAGVSGGGLAAAQELQAAGPQVVQQVAGLQAQLSAAGAALGTDVSVTMYQSGVDIATASVQGIQAKIVDNQAAIGLMQAALADSIKGLGINTKPLMKGVGADVAKGFADGITGSQSDLDKVVAKLGKAVVTKLRKELDSHSPSRKAIAVGEDFGAGYAIGIDNMQADAERAATGLAAIPGAALGDVSADLAQAPAPITQVFNGPMGYTRDEVADTIATKGRRALNGVNIPRVRVG